MRFLGARIAGKPGVTLLDPRTQAIRYVPSDGSSPNDGAAFANRFGNGAASPPITAPIDPYQPLPPQQPTRLPGLVSGKQMPETRLPLSVFGLSDDSDTPDPGVEEFLSRWIRPLLQQ